MRAWFPLFAVIFAVGCKGGSADSDADTDTNGEADTGYPSTFPGGKFRLDAFALLPADQGGDVDGDGTQDNNLPNLLNFAAFTLPELAPDQLNATIAAQIADGTLIQLLDAHYPAGDLSVDLLAGADDGTGNLTVDPASLDDAGHPTSTLVGEFSDQTTFDATSDSIHVAVTFIVGDPPIPVPFRNAVLAGTMDENEVSGMLYGVAPSDDLQNQVVEPLIPDEGYDSDGDGTIDYTKDQLMGIVHDIVNNENLADYHFDDGSNGVSSAFSFHAVVADF
jgi:hypothetical protein